MPRRSLTVELLSGFTRAFDCETVQITPNQTLLVTHPVGGYTEIPLSRILLWSSGPLPDGPAPAAPLPVIDPVDHTPPWLADPLDLTGAYPVQGADGRHAAPGRPDGLPGGSGGSGD